MQFLLLRRQLANDRCNSSFPFLSFLLTFLVTTLLFSRNFVLKTLKTFAGTSCGTLRSAAQPCFELNALKTFFANTRNMAFNELSPWSAVSLQLFFLVLMGYIGDPWAEGLNMGLDHSWSKPIPRAFGPWVTYIPH